ncbi:Uncharacterised protein [Halioglobus japonicus]|nr:Uncharacterised protein [Halioglobus japonicus]
MKKLMLGLLVFLSAVELANAQTVALTALGSLELDYERPVAVAVYPGQPLAARVAFRNGEAFIVPSPGRVQQIEYLVEPGATVTEGQPFAVLRGPEMHHFEMSFESNRALAASAEQRFRSNKPLYERKTISESLWREISENYYTSQLEYEHMRHFFELVVDGDNDPSALTLMAPVASIIDYQPNSSEVEEGDSIALFIPQEAIRLETALPSTIGAHVTALQVGDCSLEIERVSAMTDGFFIQAWTQPLPMDCSLMLGQQVLALPFVRASNAYRVLKSAVFQIERQSYVWVRRGDNLVAVAVTVLGAERDGYVVHSEVPLSGIDTLISSVSAVQGVLLGLGGE